MCNKAKEQAMDFQQERYAKGAAGYDERIRKTFPFYETIHTAINAVLRVYLGPESEILIVGAGTGAEILELGKTNSSWRFLGVDPAKPMLDLAKEKSKPRDLLIESVCLTDLSGICRSANSATAQLQR
jgi:tRNA (cmo5U34)-methyltransferase